MRTTITPATWRPIDVAYLKTHTRVDEDAEDDLLEMAISAATEAAENETGRILADSTVEFTFPASSQIALPTAPVRSLVSVGVEDKKGGRTAIEGDQWLGVSDNAATLYELPRVAGRVVVTLQAGYESADAVPAAIRHAIAIHAASSFANREGQDQGAAAAFKALLAPYRVI